MSQVFFFCSLFDGNVSLIYKCRVDTELCCGRGCCLSVPLPTPLWMQWYFWFGISMVLVLMSVGALLISSYNNNRRQLAVDNENMVPSIISRYGIRHILGVQNGRVATVAATSPVCGPTGLIQPSVRYAKFSPTRENVGSALELGPLRPLRPAFAAQPVSNHCLSPSINTEHIL